MTLANNETVRITFILLSPLTGVWKLTCARRADELAFWEGQSSCVTAHFKRWLNPSVITHHSPLRAVGYFDAAAGIIITFGHWLTFRRSAVCNN